MGQVDLDIQESIARCLAGDRLAFGPLHAAHAPSVAAFFLRSGFDAALAEDLTQDTFLRAYRSLATFDPDKAAFSTWVGSIARNVARRHWQRRRETEHFDETLAQDVLAHDDDLVADLADAEAMTGLHGCLASLDAEAAELIRLRYVQAMTTRGMASHLQLPESTIRLKLAQAHRRLEQCMRKKGFL